MNTGMSTHDHVQHGDGVYGEHGHRINSLDVVKAIAQVGKDAEEFMDKYYQLRRRILWAINTCGDCEDCWEEWGEHDGNIPEKVMEEIVSALVDALPGMPDRLSRFSAKECTAKHIREVLRRHRGQKGGEGHGI